MKTTVIFDLDGTLLYTIEDLTDGVNYALNKFGYPLKTVEEVTRYVGNGIKMLIVRCIPNGEDNPDFNRVLAEFRTYYSENCMIKTRPYDGIPELIEELSAKNIKIAIVSNKNDVAVKRLCEKYFPEHIKTAVGERDGVKRKPAPDSVFAAVAELGSSIDESVYVGDSEVDIKTAANAGMDAVLVDWGFRSRELLESLGADVIISKPDQLLTVLGIN